MALDPHDPRGAREQLMSLLRDKIESEEIPPGSKLPSARELAKIYEVGPETARWVMTQLKMLGLVTTRKGAGVYARQRPSVRRHGMERYARSTWSGPEGRPILSAEAERQGKQARQAMRALEETPAPPQVADRLEVPEGQVVWVRRRTTYIDEVPNQVADSYFRLEDIEGTPLKQVETGPGGSFARLEDQGFRLAEVREEFTARTPTTWESVELQISQGVPVIELYRTLYATDERPVEVMHAVMSSALTAFDYRFTIPD
ncbi:GntR family transcriptional regulator [Nocardiopsis halophila]|uniref:GntR family transcriptional regulator n=1 Tax=Nocardiopsis halophila TaxID=141692 RepID=UPI000476A088|nr:GntR family transcriptional regulator [Nocardiopsis halophila]